MKANKTIRDYLNAKPGDRILYHRGFLAIDRRPRYDAIPEEKKRAHDLSYLAGYFAAEQEIKNCSIVQNRVDEMVYEYIAIKRGERR